MGPRDRNGSNLATLRTDTHAYVQFGNGEWLCFDLAADPTCRTAITDPAVVLPLAQEMLPWRAQHTDRLLADMLFEAEGFLLGEAPSPFHTGPFQPAGPEAQGPGPRQPKLRQT